MLRAFVNVRGGSAVNQQAEQFRPAVMASGIHDLLSLIDQGEIEVGEDYALPRANGLAEQTSVRRTIAVQQPLERGPMLPPVSLAICAS